MIVSLITMSIKNLIANYESLFEYAKANIIFKHSFRNFILDLFFGTLESGTLFELITALKPLFYFTYWTCSVIFEQTLNAVPLYNHLPQK